MQPAPLDPLTALLAPAATKLTCTVPEENLVENGTVAVDSSPKGGNKSSYTSPMKQPSVQHMADLTCESSSTDASLLRGTGQPSYKRNTSGSSAAHSEQNCSIKTRINQFQEVLQADCIDVSRLRSIVFHGIPDREGLRPTCWKLLLNYLPPERNLWQKVLGEKREAYKVFCKELIIDPKQAQADAHDDHPLSQHTNSRWMAYFKDAEMMEQIDRDVMRTHPDMHFFSGSDGDAVTHRNEMKRVLFVFAKLNPGLRYIQGMNELLAPLYFQFRNDPGADAKEFAEADAFYCFMDIIAEFRDHFCQQLDNSKVGIRATLSKLADLLQQKDPQLWSHLQVTNKVNTQFYGFRWITLLLTQEFPFPDSVRLWDSLFSDPRGRYNCLLRFCCAMLLNVRDQLLKGDFSHNLKLLQRYPSVDVHDILSRAANL